MSEFTTEQLYKIEQDIFHHFQNLDPYHWKNTLWDTVNTSYGQTVARVSYGGRAQILAPKPIRKTKGAGEQLYCVFDYYSIARCNNEREYKLQYKGQYSKMFDRSKPETMGWN